MPTCVSYSRTLSVVAGFTAALAVASAAYAGDGSVRPNYKFSDGAAGFQLKTHGGPVNPGIFVGFNPQPEPPGDFTPTALNAYRTPTLDLSNAFAPIFYADGGGSSFVFELYHSFGDGSVRPLDVPNSDGFTRFEHRVGDHLIVFNFQFGGGPGAVDPRSWSSFNPQPDPPGDGLAQQFGFLVPAVHTAALDALGDAGRGDPFVRIGMTIDGEAISFSATPEPATWAVMLLGFGGTGAVLRRRRRRPALA